MFWGHIKESGLLVNPCDVVPFRNFDPDLHLDMVNFYFQFCDNYQNYLNDSETELIPIFVTKDQEEIFNNISNRTNAKLISKCEEFITF